MQKPCSPCIRFKPFSAYPSAENNTAWFPQQPETRERREGGRPACRAAAAPDPSAVLSIDGSKKLLLSRAPHTERAPGGTAGRAFRQSSHTGCQQPRLVRECLGVRLQQSRSMEMALQ